MRNFIYIILIVIFFCEIIVGLTANSHFKVVCYWNSTSTLRSGAGRFVLDDLRPALKHCTHLVYGFAGIDEQTSEVVPLHPKLDTRNGYGNYQLFTHLKRFNPSLKIYLSVGGSADPDENGKKYFQVLETPERRIKFVDSLERLLKDYDFDGVDLAWQCGYEKKVPEESNIFKTIWKHIKNTFFRDYSDEEAESHRNGFIALVQELQKKLKPRHGDVTLTILPQVNFTACYDISHLMPWLDSIHVFTFDQSTPFKNPKKADYPTPIYHSRGRDVENNMDAITRKLLLQGVPSYKIVLGLSTYARTWSLSSQSNASDTLPILANGPGPKGSHTNMPGLLAYNEVCTALTEHIHGNLKRVNDHPNKFAYLPYNNVTQADGLLIIYEDPESIEEKAHYVKLKNLSGIALYDLSLDDFQGYCSGTKFPLIKAVKRELEVLSNEFQTSSWLFKAVRHIV